METVGLAWVQPPFGEHAFIEPAVRRGLKLSPGVMTWRWKDREFPEPALEANRAGPPPNTVESWQAGNTPVYVRNSPPYAAVDNDGGANLCFAAGAGGHLQISCNTDTPGTLVVRENTWSGWYAWQDGERIPLLEGQQWLAVNAAAGEHTYDFRYLPWDVPLGIILFLLGCVLCVYLWRKDDPETES